ncbi:MAG TPA: hypothetical protein DCS83_02170 [Prevotella sp.]|nr:hypothetical protein [Prevotella sp.]
MSKDTNIISDLRSFFSRKENNRAIDRIMRVMKHIKIRPGQLGLEKKENCKFTNLQVLNQLVPMPLFLIRNVHQYSGSMLRGMFTCEKDMPYRFLNNGDMKWRKLLHTTNLQLIRKTSRGIDKHGNKPSYLIIDDTDVPKTGKKSELIGRIFSHVAHKSILGYKCLTLLFSGGRSQLILDFSLRGGEGRKGQWNGLLTMDLSLDFLKAYRIYSMRWATEVAYYVHHIVMESYT